MRFSLPNHPLRLRHTGGGSHEQSRVKRAQIESAVESVGERGQVSRCVFAEVERMVAAAQTRLEVTEYGVDPLELGQVLRRSEEHTSELQSLMRISYAVFCLKKKNTYSINDLYDKHYTQNVHIYNY